MERRYPTHLDTRLCPTAEMAKSPFAGCERIREPYVITGKSPLRDRLAYEVRTDSGKTGFVEYSEYLLASKSEADRAADAEQAATAKAAETECKRKGGVSVGMTRAQVHASCWGKPQRVNTTTTTGGDHEQYVYPGYNYLYLRNGIVTSIQTSR